MEMVARSQHCIPIEHDIGKHEKLARPFRGFPQPGRFSTSPTGQHFCVTKADGHQAEDQLGAVLDEHNFERSPSMANGFPAA